MRSSYVYLNVYRNGYMYVGSHSWDGPTGELDPNYIGSSSVAKFYKWEPVKIKILEVTSKENALKREQWWINHYLKTFGIAPCCKVLMKYPNWAEKWDDGVMLNCHSNDASVMTNPESQKKRIQTQRANGSLLRITQKASSCRTSESFKKRVKTIGDFTEITAKALAAHTEETYQKMVSNRSKTHYKNVAKSIDYSKVAIKLKQSKKGLINNNYLVKCGDLVGTTISVCRQLGHPEWSIWVNRRWKKGLLEVSRGGYTFSLLEINGVRVG